MALILTSRPSFRNIFPYHSWRASMKIVTKQTTWALSFWCPIKCKIYCHDDIDLANDSASPTGANNGRYRLETVSSKKSLRTIQWNARLAKESFKKTPLRWPVFKPSHQNRLGFHCRWIPVMNLMIVNDSVNCIERSWESLVCLQLLLKVKIRINGD